MFNSHGTLIINREDNIVILDGVGPWNEESVLSAREFFSKLHQEMRNDVWGLIAILRGESVHTPEASEQLIESIKKDKRNGRFCSALVLSDAEFPQMAKIHITNIYKAAGETYEIFDSLIEAKK